MNFYSVFNSIARFYKASQSYDFIYVYDLYLVAQSMHKFGQLLNSP